MREKIRILVSMYDSDYYVVVGVAWRPKRHKIGQRISKNYQRGDIARLSSHERVETFSCFLHNQKHMLKNLLEIQMPR